MREENTYKNAVIRLQRYLRQLEHELGEINRVPIDGIFGDDTRAALMRFQAYAGLRVTGISDIVTWEMLYAEYQKSLDKKSSTLGIFPFFDLPDEYELKLGDNNTLVSMLEIIMSEISSEYTEMQDAFKVNGVFDSDKSNLIREYQKKNLIPESGTVNRATWNRLAEDFNSFIRKNQ